MILNEGKRKVPVKFYEDKYGTIIYDSNFIQGTSPSLEEAFDKFKDDNFIRDLEYYYDDIVGVKIGRFIPTLEDKTWKGMKYLGKLEIEVETLTQPFFSQSNRSLNYLSKNKNKIPKHLAWIKDMKQKELSLKEMFEPEKTNNKLICKHCGVTIPEGCYYERYRGEVYHLECIWDKLINNHDTSLYDEAKKFFWSLQKYIGNWPGYGFDVEEDYVSDTVLVKHNYFIQGLKENLNESYKNLFSDLDKQKYANEVYELLQNSYKKIGGLKGRGFTSAQDMINTFPMWKLNIKNGKLVFAAVYRDKMGRKTVCAGTDGSREGLLTLKDFMKAELATGRSWSEISGPVLKLCQKYFPELLEKALIKPEKIKELDDEVELVSDTTYSRPLSNGERIEKTAFGRMNQPIQ